MNKEEIHPFPVEKGASWVCAWRKMEWLEVVVVAAGESFSLMG